MVLKVYNTLSRKKENFKPLNDKKVGMYVCGPTIYNYVHVGNLRAYAFADNLRRVLESNGYEVKEVMNLTDVDDKTIKRSQEEKEPLRKFTEKYEKAFVKDLKDLNLEMPDVMPRATDNIKEMVEIIKTLLKKEIAYKTEDGIYFSIKKFKNYGKLSGVETKKLKTGASGRVMKDEYEKDSANDFALWKFYDKSDGDVFWETEIGKGRPGWHIECSAMSTKYLGKQFDIHVGGVDLIFPHHENEIAQSEASFGKEPWVKYWMHNEWILVDGEKMSKSKKNFYKLPDIIEKSYKPMHLKYFYLLGHYRKPLNFTWKNLDAAKNAYERLKKILAEFEKSGEKKNSKNMNGAWAQFLEYVNDDLNTSRAISFLWEILREDKLNNSEKYELAIKFDKILGLELSKKEKRKIPSEILKLAEEREKFREEKNWGKSDELRETIKKKGYEIEDTEKGWEIKKL